MRLVAALIAGILVAYLAGLPLFIVTYRLTDSCPPVTQAIVGVICNIFGLVAGFLAFRAIMKRKRK